MKWCLPLFLLVLAGCSTTGTATDNKDPYEEYNRSVWEFNKDVDSWILRPIAVGYKAITPDPVENGISNFFSNLGEIKTVINDLLQGKFGKAGRDSGRFLINTTLGIGGLFDPATEFGLEEQSEDFGQTLAVWGFDQGAYIMVPFLGPTTTRDGFGMVVDSVAMYSPYDELNDNQTELGLRALDLIQTRAGLLSLDEQLNAAVDDYTLVRDVYLQSREFDVYDGEPPLEDDECEFEEDCEDPDDF